MSNIGGQMQRLIEGFRRFRKTYFEQNRDLFSALSQSGQAPKILLIGCCDSRVDPALIFEAEPGEVFTLRNIANLVPPYTPDKGHHGTSAALEFAVRNLEVEHIIVMGHSYCGGVAALLSEKHVSDRDFVQSWMEIARSARDRALALGLSATDQPISSEQMHRICEQETVAISMSNVMTFPWVLDRMREGRLSLHGWWYDLENGNLFRLDPHTNTFQQV